MYGKPRGLLKFDKASGQFGKANSRIDTDTPCLATGMAHFWKEQAEKLKEETAKAPESKKQPVVLDLQDTDSDDKVKLPSNPSKQKPPSVAAATVTETPPSAKKKKLFLTKVTPSTCRRPMKLPTAAPAKKKSFKPLDGDTHVDVEYPIHIGPGKKQHQETLT